jgi:serine phosphatase RsbU (regulator of sigma subunit)
MAYVGNEQPRTGLRRHRPAATVAWMLTLPTGLLLVNAFLPTSIQLGPLMVASPAMAAVFCGPIGTFVIFVVAVCCTLATGFMDGIIDTTNFHMQLLASVLISCGAVAAAALRTRRERELAQSRWATEMTQRVLLRPLPRQMGPLAISSLYLAADEESAIGGDLYAATTVGNTARVLVGDAQGKGLAAVEAVNSLLGAFRQAGRHDKTLPSLAADLERSLTEEVRESVDTAGGESSFLEGFVTAVMADVPHDEDTVHILNLGHPSPLIIRGGTVLSVDPAIPALPLGLGDLAEDPPSVDTVSFLRGDILLLYTDGVIEARDSAGTFYPLVERLPNWSGGTPDELLQAIGADLQRHTRARLADDVAMVAIHRAR